jgi:hypothetical protein
VLLTNSVTGVVLRDLLRGAVCDADPLAPHCTSGHTP